MIAYGAFWHVHVHRSTSAKYAGTHLFVLGSEVSGPAATLHCCCLLVQPSLCGSRTHDLVYSSWVVGLHNTEQKTFACSYVGRILMSVLTVRKSG